MVSVSYSCSNHPILISGRRKGLRKTCLHFQFFKWAAWKSPLCPANKEKLNWLKINYSAWISKTEEETRQITTPNIATDREFWFPQAEMKEQNTVGTSARGKKNWTVIGRLLKTQCGQVWELKKNSEEPNHIPLAPYLPAVLWNLPPGI